MKESVRPVPKEITEKETASEGFDESGGGGISQRPKNIVRVGCNVQEQASSGARHDDGPRDNEEIIIRFLVILEVLVDAALASYEESC